MFFVCVHCKASLFEVTEGRHCPYPAVHDWGILKVTHSVTGVWVGFWRMGKEGRGGKGRGGKGRGGKGRGGKGRGEEGRGEERREGERREGERKEGDLFCRYKLN